jgi:hypothetical protein
MTKQAYCVGIRPSVQLRTHSAREINSGGIALRRSFVLSEATKDRNHPYQKTKGGALVTRPISSHNRG